MEALLAITLTLVATTVVLLLVLIVRRLLLARRERRHATAADWLLPVAIEFVAGDEPLPDGLSAYDQTVLAEQLRRYSQMLSGEATERIALYFRDSDALREARRGLHSRRAWRRADAAFALGDMGIDETTPDLLRALGDRKRIVRTAAARALGRLKAEEATVPLVEAFVDNRVPRGVAGDALLRMGPKIAPQLRELAGSREIELQATALTLLGLVGGAGDSDVPLERLQDPAADVRVAAAEALGRIGSPDCEPALEDALDDRMRLVRAAAASSLGTIGSRDALPKLLDIARTDEFRAARAAAQAAVKLDFAIAQAAADAPDAGPHLREAVDRAAL
jgi:HEAT repeat protein